MTNIESLKAKLSQEGESAELLLQLAIEYREQNELNEALKTLERILQLAPDFAPAYFSLAVCLTRILAAESDRDRALKFFAKTVSAYRKGLNIQPDNLAARMNLALLLHEWGQIPEAAKEYQALLSMDPQNPDVWSNLGACHQALQDDDSASQCFHKALSLEASHPAAAAALIGLLDASGELAQAKATAERALNADPGRYELTLPYVQILRQTGELETALSAIQDVNNDALVPEQLRQLKYTEGDVLNDSAHYDEAFEAYKIANDLTPTRYSEQAFKQYVDARVEFFSKENIDNIPESHSQSDAPILIIGMPRSGTSLVEQVLASHPAVYGAGELKYLGEQTQQIAGYPHALTELSAEQLDGLAEQYLSQVREVAIKEKPGCTRFTDKMWQNFEYLPYIAKLFPKAKFIHCKRHPLDVVVSCYFQSFGSQGVPFSYRLEHIRAYYEGYESMMSAFKPLYEDRIYELSYELLVADFENQAKALMNYLDIDWHEDCGNFHRTKRTVKTASYAQVRTPLYVKAMRRFEHYREYLAPVLELERFWKAPQP